MRRLGSGGTEQALVEPEPYAYPVPTSWDESADARTRELQRLVLQVARSSKQTHLQIAATLDRLAETGAPKDAARRRELAARARRFAEIEDRHIAALEAEGDGA